MAASGSCRRGTLALVPAMPGWSPVMVWLPILAVIFAPVNLEEAFVDEAELDLLLFGIIAP